MHPLGKIKAKVITIKAKAITIQLMDDSKIVIPRKFFNFTDIVLNQEVFYQLVEHKDGTFQQEIIAIENDKLTPEQIKEIYDSK